MQVPTHRLRYTQVIHNYCLYRLSNSSSGGPPKKRRSTVSEFASGLDGASLNSVGKKKKRKTGLKPRAPVHR